MKTKRKIYKEGGEIMKAQRKEVMVDAPKGYHWMTEKGRHYLMPHSDDFVAHKGASVKAPFKVKTAH